METPEREPLGDYRAKRDFSQTPEPPPATGRPAGELARFVVQEHHATSLHWDLRLERDGVLASWAVPKSIPPDPRVNHLAVHTEDHPLEYLTFHGVIPEGNYGAGSMTVWDTGTYEAEKWSEREVIFTLHGERATGRHALVHTRGNQWLIHRMDPPADRGRELLPSGWRPMQPITGALPDGPGWAYEVDWGGPRVVAAFEGGRVAEALDADGRDLAAGVPELARLGEALGTLPVVLDGQVVVLGTDGGPDAALVERRLSARSASTVRRLANDHPATFIVSDLLWLDGHSATGLAWAHRRALLEGLELRGERWATPSALDDGPAVLDAAAAQGLAGVLAKRRDSPYLPGTQSDQWRAVAVDAAG